MKETRKQSLQNTLCDVFIILMFIGFVGFACFSHSTKVAADDTVTQIVTSKHYNMTQIRLEIYDEATLIAATSEYEGNAQYNSSTSNNAIVKWLVNKSIKTDYTGKIAVSYDLSQAEVEESDEGIVVTLPEAEIYMNEVEFTNCKSDDAIFSSDINYKDFQKLENKIEALELDNAIEEGLYNKAQLSIEKTITQLVEDVAGEEVKVTFQYK